MFFILFLRSKSALIQNEIIVLWVELRKCFITFWVRVEKYFEISWRRLFNKMPAWWSLKAVRCLYVYHEDIYGVINDSCYVRWTLLNIKLHKNIFQYENKMSRWSQSNSRNASCRVLRLVVGQKIPNFHSPLLTAHLGFTFNLHDCWESMPMIEQLPFDLAKKKMICGHGNTRWSMR